MLSAFQYLHKENIVHRDLKAENLMLDDQHNLKIIDFGLSNDMTGKEYLDTQCGSMAYSAPELLGSYNYGKEVDIWSIGVCLYVLLTGSLPFGNIESLTELHALMLDGTYTLPDAMSESLKDLFLQMFQIKARKRITMEQLWAHPWITGIGDPQPPLVCPLRKLTLTAVNVDVVSQMARMGFEREAAIIQSLLENKCDSISATYHLMISKSNKADRKREAAEARLQAGLEDRRAREERKKSSSGMSRRRSSTLSDDRSMSRSGSAASINSTGRGGKRTPSSTSVGRRDSNNGADSSSGSCSKGLGIVPGDEGRLVRKSSGRRPASREGSSTTGRRRSSSLVEPETFSRRGGSGKVGAGKLARKHSTNSDEEWAPGHGGGGRQHQNGSAAPSRWANTHGDDNGNGGGGGGGDSLGSSPRRKMSGRNSASSSGGTRIRRYSSTGSTHSSGGNGDDEDLSSGRLSGTRRPPSTSPSPGRGGSSARRPQGGRMRLSSEEIDLDDFDDHIEFGFGPIDAHPPSRESSSSGIDANQCFHATLLAMARVCEGGTIKDYNPEVMSEKLCFLAHKALREAPDNSLVKAMRKHGWNGIEFDDPIRQRLAIREELNAILDDAGVGFGFAADPTFGPTSGGTNGSAGGLSSASLATSPRESAIESASVRRRSQSLSSAGRPRPSSLDLTDTFRESSARPRSTRATSGRGRLSPDGGGGSSSGATSPRPLSRSGSASRAKSGRDSGSGRLRRRPSFNESIAVSALPNIAGEEGSVLENPFGDDNRPAARGPSAGSMLRPVRVGSGRNRHGGTI